MAWHITIARLLKQIFENTAEVVRLKDIPDPFTGYPVKKSKVMFVDGRWDGEDVFRALYLMKSF